jgi:hypothetical protein
MWIYTTVGFFSVVQKKGQADDLLMVRGRFRGDLEALREAYLPELGVVTEHGGTDYAFRAPVTKVAFARAMARIVAALTYDNFKNEVSRTQGYGRTSIYHDVWDVMIREQNRAERTRKLDTLRQDHGRSVQPKGKGKGRKGEQRVTIRPPEDRNDAPSRYRRGPDGYLREYPQGWENEDDRYSYLRDLPDDNA